MSEVQAKTQTKQDDSDIKDFIQDIVSAYDARVKMVGKIVEDTNTMMGEFRERREHMSGELKEVLARCESLRRRDFDQMMANIVLTQTKREEEVKKMLEDFRKEEEGVASKLRAVLARKEHVRVRDFKKMLSRIQKEQEKRVKEASNSISGEIIKIKNEAHTMLDEFKRERLRMADEWRAAAALLKEKRKNPLKIQE